jgi:hypothetical protein
VSTAAGEPACDDATLPLSGASCASWSSLPLPQAAQPHNMLHAINQRAVARYLELICESSERAAFRSQVAAAS